MFAVKPRIEIVIRVLLTTVISFNVPLPDPVNGWAFYLPDAAS
ncbi:MAG TPA: hypothetical protein VJ022_08255 [Anaerolineales bacterium]|nr:hypothetical protein [Anaerolineales bacterium]